MKHSEVKELILGKEEELINHRRHFHRHPELSLEEFETTKTLAAELDALGIPYRLTKPTGLIADIAGKGPGKTVALRADMDALPVEEINKDLSYKSEADGKMHACGHDSHMAMLLTAVKVLHAVRDRFNGTVRIIFQPAEEAAAGAKLMIEQGALEGVDGIFGEHIWSPLKAGLVSCIDGPCMAACDVFRVTFTGKGGHGAVPETAIDATVMAAAFVSNVQTIVSRNINPLDTAVVTVGKLVSGTRFNVISGEAYLEGTVRTFSEHDRTLVEEKLRTFAKDTAHMYGGTAEFSYEYGTDVVDNNPAEASRVRKLAAKAFGEDQVFNEPKRCIGEDFAAYMKVVPGAFAYVGAENEAKGACWPHHNGHFNIDEDALKVGAELYALYALDFLGALED